MALKELEVRYAARRSKDYKLADGGGLYVLVRPNGSKLWRLKYRFDGKEKLLSLGPYLNYRHEIELGRRLACHRVEARISVEPSSDVRAMLEMALSSFDSRTDPQVYVAYSLSSATISPSGALKPGPLPRSMSNASSSLAAVSCASSRSRLVLPAAGGPSISVNSVPVLSATAASGRDARQ
jgi:hypothetical protein